MTDLLEAHKKLFQLARQAFGLRHSRRRTRLRILLRKLLARHLAAQVHAFFVAPQRPALDWLGNLEPVADDAAGAAMDLVNGLDTSTFLEDRHLVGFVVGLKADGVSAETDLVRDLREGSAV